MQLRERLLVTEPFAPPPLVPLRKTNLQIGEYLVEAGQIDRETLRDALFRKYETKAQLGTILLDRDQITENALADAIAEQWQLGIVNLDVYRPEPELLTDIDPAACLRLECIPWRLIHGVPVIVLTDPSRANEAKQACGFNDIGVAVAVATRTEILSLLEQLFSSELEQRACESCPSHLSARGLNTQHFKTIGGTLLATIIAAALLAPQTFFWCLFGYILLTNFSTALFRLTLVAARLWPEKPRADSHSEATRLSDHRELPHISIMIGLLNEDLVLPSLLKHLAALNYPKERLDILLMLEEGDETTQKHLAEITPARPFDVIITPKGTLKTKPRALNYGLNFCRGEIIGILDAEDRPEPDQIRAVVETLHSAPPDVACVQGVLDFYNARRNWFSRCFTMEYTIWFRVLLKGMQRLRLPIPLGGTTVYFRRTALEKVGGWDAHNVTEDADLGIRLCRYGYRTEVMSSKTMEEANAAVIPWIKQRSRWIKGYMITWATHMRDPIGLARELGIPGFIAFQLILLGGVSSYLSIPLLWMLWIGAVGFDLSANLGGSEILWKTAFYSMIFGQTVMLCVALSALSGSDKRHLIPWVFTLPIYWPFGAIAAFKALFEVFYAPYYWDKTAHGTQSDQTTENETSPRLPIETANSQGASIR